MDKQIRNRIVLIFVIVILIFTGIIAKLAWINIVEGEKLREVVKAEKKHTETISAIRGRIFDRNGVLLAQSQYRYKITIDLKRFNNLSALNTYENIDGFLQEMSALTGMSEEEIRQVMVDAIGENKRSIFLTYIEDRKVAQKLTLMNFRYGLLWIDKQEERKYPNGTMASDVLGMVQYISDSEIKGQMGVEYALNSQLTGIDGYYRAEVDSNNIELVHSTPEYLEPQNGNDVYLTIDSVIQYKVEKAIKKGFENEQALAVHGLVMDVKTGEILAMASYPNFNPETRKYALEDEELYAEQASITTNDIGSYILKNDFIQSAYELGSPVKLLTAAIALEYDYYTLDSKFKDMNVYMVDGTPIRCWYYPHLHKNMTLKKSIADSHNPAFVEMGLKMGVDLMYDSFSDFGLYDKTGINLPGETRNIPFTREQLKKSNVNLATTTFGQGGTYTPLQLVMALSSVVNGDLMKPHIIKRIQQEDGVLVNETKPEIVRKVISEVTAQQIQEAMEYTVTDGSGKNININGLRIGAKTGTAQKINPTTNTYYEDRVMASFVAVAPIDDPEILIYILVDDPQVNLHGSDSAAPIAREIMEDVAHELNLYNMEDVVLDIEVPNVMGMTVKKARETLEEIGLYGSIRATDEYSDDSIVTKQIPNPGSKRAKGQSILMEVE